VERFQRRVVQSPDPVARRFPVGEKDAQRIGELCPIESCIRIDFSDSGIHK
jgi:hypothetical protein